MLAHYQTIIVNQYDAALFMLAICVDQCPAENWRKPVANLRFCQVVFHALIFTDLYLDRDEESLRNQPFHLEHSAIFGDYEEFEDRVQQQLYEKEFIQKYIQHCRDKAKRILTNETAESLNGPCGFPRKDFSRAELHILTIRHLQHHVAQLSLRLRIDARIDTPWLSSGWREV